MPRRNALALLASLAGLAFPAWGPVRGLAAQEAAADSAWEQGDASEAERLYGLRLAADSTDATALHRLALLYSWDARYDESLHLLRRLAREVPGDREAAHVRARVLSWADRLEEAERLYDSLYASDPADLDAAHGRARIAAWQGRIGEAEAEYARLTERFPDDPEAAAGFARMAAWDGRLGEAERRWRDLAARKPDEPAAWVGLARTQRWQGREYAAAKTLERAAELSPLDPDVLAEGIHLRAWRGPSVSPRISLEWDSDGNSILSLRSAAAYRAFPGVGVVARLGWLEARQDRFDRPGEAVGGAIGVEVPIGTGWLARMEGGMTELQLRGARSVGSVDLSLASPTFGAVSGSIAWRRQAVAGTALMIASGVVEQTAEVTARAMPGGWDVRGSLAVGTFQGTESNRRIGGSLSGTRRLRPDVTAGLALRGFGFANDLADGYFDPELYGVLELPVTGASALGGLDVRALLAPGIQTIQGRGGTSGALRARVDVSRFFAPGREVGLGAGVARSGLNSAASGSGYWYASVEAWAGWSF